MDFSLLPPEINSGLMYAGAGSGPLLTAANAWDALATELRSTAADAAAVVAGLSTAWAGPSSKTMATNAASYTRWLTATAAQAEQTASQARAAVGAYESAFRGVEPPSVIAANRANLLALTARNVFGQNSHAIMALEAQYAEMWAQDAAAMNAYQTSSANLVLPTFAPPPRAADPAGPAAQGASMAQAAADPAAALPVNLIPLLGLLATYQTAFYGGGLGTTVPFSTLSLFTTLFGLSAPNTPIATALTHMSDVAERNANAAPPPPPPAPKAVEPPSVRVSVGNRLGPISVPPSWAPQPPRPAPPVVPLPAGEVPAPLPLPLPLVGPGARTGQRRVRADPEYGFASKVVTRPPSGG